jgi:hypothetical protein
MKRFTYLLVGVLAIAVLAGACASTQQRGLDLVTRAVQASGGPVALGGVKTISEKGTVKQWEPEQSAVAGGEMRFSNESTIDAVTDVATRTTRIDWVRNYHYPAPRTFTFSEIVTPTAGYVAGVDSNGAPSRARSRIPPRIRCPECAWPPCSGSFSATRRSSCSRCSRIPRTSPRSATSASAAASPTPPSTTVPAIRSSP